MKFYNGRRGYVTVTLGEQQARADFRTVAAVTTPGAPITTAASFVTEAGDPGPQAGVAGRGASSKGSRPPPRRS